MNRSEIKRKLKNTSPIAPYTYAKLVLSDILQSRKSQALFASSPTFTNASLCQSAGYGLRLQDNYNNNAQYVSSDPAFQLKFTTHDAQAGQCGRCRADTGQAGRVCAHCKFDEVQIKWELRLFSLQAHALKKSRTSITAEDAVKKVILLIARTAAHNMDVMYPQA